jgi:hypothetical protein
MEGEGVWDRGGREVVEGDNVGRDRRGGGGKKSGVGEADADRGGGEGGGVFERDDLEDLDGQGGLADEEVNADGRDVDERRGSEEGVGGGAESKL